MTATFRVFLAGGRQLTEEALRSGSFAYDDLFSPSGLCEGAISISDDLELADELPALVKNLCLAANGELGRSGRATYQFHGWPGQITLLRDGAEVIIEGDGVRSARFELEAFTTGLRDCAARFIGVLREIRCREPARDPERLDLIAFLEAAMRASA